MPYQAIQAAHAAAPFTSKTAAQAFLDQFQPATQLQIISAMYLGREQLHQDDFREDLVQYASPEGLSKYCDHINANEFARILDDKGDAAKKYFSRFLICKQSMS